jgi:glyoxylate reductase
MTNKPRVFVSQPIAPSALDRLRTIADVKINTDSSKIIAKGKLIAAVKKCDILFSLLHDKVDRAVLAANPKLRAVASMSITPDNIDLTEANKRGIAVT